jgi:hypothetical protein
MEDEATLLVEVWEAMKEYLPSNTLNDAADALVTAFINQGVDIRNLLEVGEECPVLERAIEANRDDENDSESDDEAY